MKILHTSDWHLGQSFMGKSRQEEHQAFLTWLTQTIEEENVDTLIVAGDIFDTATPPNYALELYYNFLTQLSSHCKNIIITAGNHDSIATLKAPKQLLHALNIHLIASGDADENEIVGIYNSEEELEGVVCAVPFLRDYVVRQSSSAQSMSDKEYSLSNGIKEHYDAVYKKALEFAKNRDIPIIATGHLTAVGSKTSESEREIYIGGTLDIGSDFLAKDFDYVALGHLHINQKVGCEHVRYSGSPIPLSFSESQSQKKVNLITFDKKEMQIKELDIPLFRSLFVVRGDLDAIIEKLEGIEDKTAWIEVHIHDANPFMTNQTIREKAEELGLTLLAVKIDKKEQALHSESFDAISLDELTPLDIFEQRIEQEKTLLEDKELTQELITNFKVILHTVEKR